MVSTRLPIKVKKQPGGFRIEFADGAYLYLYATKDDHVARTMPLFPEAEALAKEVARTLTDVWSKAR